MRGILIAFFFFIITYVIFYHSRGILENFANMPYSKPVPEPNITDSINNYTIDKPDILLSDVYPPNPEPQHTYTPHEATDINGSFLQTTNNTYPTNIDKKCNSRDVCNRLYGEIEKSPDKIVAPDDKYVRVGFFNTDTQINS